MRREVVALAVIFLATSACDPCAGTFECRGSPVLRLEGRVVHVISGRSIDGAEVSASIGGHTATTTTGSDGLFALAIPTPVADSARYDLSVRPPGDTAFQAKGLTCRVSVVRGSGCPLGLVVSRPYFPDFAEIHYRSSNNVIVPSARLRFTRTGGVRFYGGDSVQNDVFTTKTSVDARVQLFGLNIYSDEVGRIIGRITVDLPPPLDSGWVDSVELASALTFREPRPLLLFRVGPSVEQTYAFTSGGSPVQGVTVRISRVSGVLTSSDTAVAVTDSAGKARLGLRPLSRGSMIVRLNVVPPAPYAPFTVDDVTLITREDDKAPLYGTWDVSTGALISTGRRRE